MTRDNQDRLSIFGATVKVERLALNYDQVEQYKPPSNPAKLTDSRASGYISEFGKASWELDALKPKVINTIIRGHIVNYMDMDLYEERKEEQEECRARLNSFVQEFES